MFKARLISFAVCFALFFVFTSCATIAKDAEAELRDFEVETLAIEGINDRSEGENNKENDEDKGENVLSEGVQQAQGMNVIEQC